MRGEKGERGGEQGRDRKREGEGEEGEEGMRKRGRILTTSGTKGLEFDDDLYLFISIILVDW